MRKKLFACVAVALSLVAGAERFVDVSKVDCRYLANAQVERVVSAEYALVSEGYAVFEEVSEAYFTLMARDALLEVAQTNAAECALRAEGVRVVGFEPGYRRGGGRSSRLCAKACELAMRAETVLLFLGLDEGGEAEGIDRSDMRLPENQLELLTALSAVSRNIVVILSCGGAVEMPWQQRARAVVHGFLGGQAGATAMARLLTGKANFIGEIRSCNHWNTAKRAGTMNT